MGVEWLHASERSAFVLRNLLTPAECAHLAALGARSTFQPAYVGGFKESKMARDIRVAETAILFELGRWQDAVHRNISRRIIERTAELPVQPAFTAHLRAGASLHPLSGEHLEFSQITRYVAGGHYTWHKDGWPDPTGCSALFAWTECRAYTAIVYLNDVPAEAGGGTGIRFADGSTAHVQPERGMGFFFVSSMRHTGEPLRRGEKLILNQWVRFRPLPALLHVGAPALLVPLHDALGVAPMALFATAERRARVVTPGHSVLAAAGVLSAAGLVALLLLGCGVAWLCRALVGRGETANGCELASGRPRWPRRRERDKCKQGV